MHSDLEPRRWMIVILCCAGVYNIVWGLSVVGFPATTLGWCRLDRQMAYPQIWQCVGMIVGVFGIGYLIAATNPFRHWPIVLVGLLGKVFGPLGLFCGVVSGSLPGSMGWMILLNDLIWWGPFTVILWSAFRHHQVSGSVHAVDFLDDDPLRELLSHTGQSLHELSVDKPQFVLFLRHTGCTFCREALCDLGRQRAAIEKLGAGIVLVHLGDESATREFLANDGLDDLPRISDPRCRLYRQCGLETGGFRQLFGWKVWLRGLRAGLIDGHGVGRISGNPFQMPGAFVVHGGRFLRGFQHEAASDRPDYLSLVQAALGVDTSAVA